MRQRCSTATRLGYQPLREWIGERHGVDPARVVVTNGSLQAFHFVLSAFPGRVIVERPTYDRPRKILARLRRGPARRRRPRCRRARAPARERGTPVFPLHDSDLSEPGGRDAVARAPQALAELASARSLRILEDDPYGLVRFEGEPLPTLFELEGGRNVMYSSSFSKTIAPGLRVGYMILPAEIAAGLEDIVASTYITPALVTEATVLEFLRRGLLEPNLERVRGCCVNGAMRCSRRSSASSAAAAAGRAPRAATSCGSSCRRAPTRPIARPRDGGGSHVRSRLGLRRRAQLRPARLQLRFARRDRRGRLAPGRISSRCGGGEAAVVALRRVPRSRR